jgi:hypothetical protein
MPHFSRRKKATGVRNADGFFLNVSNYQTTEESTIFGGSASHGVAETGKAPTANTGSALVDAYLWVKSRASQTVPAGSEDGSRFASARAARRRAPTAFTCELHLCLIGLCR